MVTSHYDPARCCCSSAVERLALHFRLVPGSSPGSGNIFHPPERLIVQKTDDAIPTRETVLEELYAGLSGRVRPETVLAKIEYLLEGELTAPERALFAQVTHPYGRSPWWEHGQYYAQWLPGSFMSTEFKPVATLERQAGVLAQLVHGVGYDFAYSRAATSELLDEARLSLGMIPGRSDFKTDRLNRAQRTARGLAMPRRQYDKLFRAVTHLEGLLSERGEQDALFELSRFAKTSFAATISHDRFIADEPTACFVAYMAANLARRSVFTSDRQVRSFDEISDLLLTRVERSSNADWLALASVFPRPAVLAQVSAEDRTALLERTLAILADTAGRLEALALGTKINTATMIVQRDNDSSTWNALAGAWNRARDYWIALVYSLGGDELFEDFLPGKVLRLMAADVAYWHKSEGDTLHDDTPIWAALPKPWEVMAGREVCGRAQIEQVCTSLGVEPASSGWTAPRPRTSVEIAGPTPETVHGGIIANPALAAFLRKIDAFSGKQLKLHKLESAPLDPDSGADDVSPSAIIIPFDASSRPAEA